MCIPILNWREKHSSQRGTDEFERMHSNIYSYVNQVCSLTRNKEEPTPLIYKPLPLIGTIPDPNIKALKKRGVNT